MHMYTADLCVYTFFLVYLFIATHIDNLVHTPLIDCKLPSAPGTSELFGPIPSPDREVLDRDRHGMDQPEVHRIC